MFRQSKSRVNVGELLNPWTLGIRSQEIHEEFETTHFDQNKRGYLSASLLRAGYLILFATLSLVTPFREVKLPVLAATYCFSAVDICIVFCLFRECIMTRRNYHFIMMAYWIVSLLFSGLVSVPVTLRSRVSEINKYELAQMGVIYHVIFMKCIDCWYFRFAGMMLVNSYVYIEGTDTVLLIVTYILVGMLTYLNYENEKYEKIMFYFMYCQNKDLTGWKDLFHSTVPLPIAIIQNNATRPQARQLEAEPVAEPVAEYLNMVYSNSYFKNEFEYAIEDLLRSHVHILKSGQVVPEGLVPDTNLHMQLRELIWQRTTNVSEL